MCTVVILSRPDHDWPLIIGANRDEMLTRPWKGPARHWTDRANVVAGLDELAGGTWMGLNDEGVFACILNRYRSLGPEKGKRSRGELVLEALDHADADAAADALAHLDPNAYRPFNMIIGDNRDVFWLKHHENDAGEAEGLDLHPLSPGLHLITAFDLNDTQDPRIARYKPAFESAPPPDPASDSFAAWMELLAEHETDGPATAALCFKTETGFGTSSSGILALPSIDLAHDEPPVRPVWHFAAGPPCETAYEPVDLGP